MNNIPKDEDLEKLVYLLAIGGKEINRQFTPPDKRLNWGKIGSIHPMTEGLTTDSGDVGIFTDVTPKDLNGKINTGMVLDNFFGGRRSDMYGIIRVKSISPGQARGLKLMPFMVKVVDARLNILDGTWEGSHTIWGCSSNKGSAAEGGWKWLDQPGQSRQPEHLDYEKSYGKQLGIALGIQWTENIWWTVDIRLGEAPGVRWFVTAESLQELWDVRDRVRKGDRVKRLINWVRQHKRVRPSTGECDVVVRQHLRGSLKFQWNEMDVVINPAYDDLSKLHDQGLARHIPDPMTVEEV